jgi:CBS domain containing-hemolysin-like protein
VVSEDQWRVEGGVALSELESALGHSFDRDDVSTVGGLVLAEFGRVPRSGESIDVEGYRLVVEHVVRRRVRRIAVHRPPVEASMAQSEKAAR